MKHVEATILGILLILSAYGQQAEVCEIYAGGERIELTADGYFDLRTLPADRPIRLYKQCLHADGSIEYGRTDFLTVPQGGILESPSFESAASPFLVPTLLEISLSSTAMSPADSGQLTATLTLSDGSQHDVTEDAGLYLLSSAPTVVTLGGAGTYTAAGTGTAVLAAAYEGVLAAAAIEVTHSEIQTTTLRGLVWDANYQPVVGVSVDGGSRAVQSQNGGIFNFEVNVHPGGYTVISAVQRTETQLFVATNTVQLIPNAYSDGGVLILGPPSDIDSDNDGVPDDLEAVIRLPFSPFVLDPNNPDSDGDGILDGDEDQEQDGLPDVYEFLIGTNPNLQDSDRPPNGFPDGAEDFDADGLTNLQEFQAGSNVYLPDTDGDLLSDYDEVQNGFDPTDSTSRPGFFAYGARTSFQRTD